MSEVNRSSSIRPSILKGSFSRTGLEKPMPKDVQLGRVHFKNDPISFRPRMWVAQRIDINSCKDKTFHPNGQLKSCNLELIVNIEGVNYKSATPIEFFDNGAVMKGTPSAPSERNGVFYKQDVPIEYHDNKKVKLGTIFNPNGEWQRIGKNLYKNESKVEYYASGLLKSVLLSDHTKVDGIYYKLGTTVEFFENGRVKSGTIFYPHGDNPYQLVGGVSYKNDTKINYYSSGVVSDVSLSDNTNINGVYYKTGTRVEFYENEQVRFGTLYNPPNTSQPIKGIQYKPDTIIRYHRNGVVLSGILNERTNTGNTWYKEGTLIQFYDNNRVKCGTVFSKDGKGKQEIGPVSYKDDTFVEFYGSGLVKLGMLAGNQLIKGVRYKDGTQIEYFEKDQVKRGILFSERDGKQKVIKQQKVEGVDYSDGTKMEYFASGKIKSIHLSDRAKIGTHFYKQNTVVEFYEENSKVKSGTLDTADKSGMQMVDDVACKNDTFVEFSTDGSMKSALLKEHTKIGNYFYKNGTWVTFYGRGQVKSGVLHNLPQNGEFQIVKDVRYRNNTRIQFYNGGRTQFVWLSDTTKIKDVDYKAGTRVNFYDDGDSVRSALLCAHTTIEGYSYKARTEVEFYKSGAVKLGTLCNNGVDSTQRVGRNNYRDNTLLEFYENKKVKSARLVENMMINGRIPCMAWTTVFFNPNDDVKRAVLSREHEFNLGNSKIAVSGGSEVDFYTNENLTGFTLTAPLNWKGVIFNAGSRVELNENGTTKFVFIKDEQRVNGVMLPKGTRLVYVGDKIDEAHLTNDGEVNDIPLKKGTIIKFRQSAGLGSIKIISDGQKIKNIPVKKNSEVSFHQNMEINIIVLGEKFPVNGVEYPRGTELTFNPDKTMFRARLLGDHVEIGGIKFPKKTIIGFDRSGDLASIEPPASSEARTPRCKGAVVVKRDAHGSLEFLREPYRFEGVVFPPKTMIEMDRVNNIKRAFLLKERVEVGNINFPKGSVLSFNGTVLIKATIGSQTVINNESFPGGSELVFDNGNVITALLGDCKTFGAYEFKRGTKLYYLNGEVEKADLDQTNMFGNINVPDETTVYFSRLKRIKRVVLNEEKLINGDKIPKKSVIEEYHLNGAMKVVNLSEQRPIQGVPCVAGKILFHPSTRLQTGTLAAYHTFNNGESRNAGFEFQMDENRNLVGQ